MLSRRYTPLWDRQPDGTIRPANPDETVPWVTQEFFFDDGDAPFWPTWLPPRPLTAERKATRARCLAILADWGVS